METRFTPVKANLPVPGPENRIQSMDAPNPLWRHSFRRHPEGIHEDIHTDHFIEF